MDNQNETAGADVQKDTVEVQGKENSILDDLLERGEGHLARINGVWAPPGSVLDPSGTNLKLPILHVSDAIVREAMAAGMLKALVVDASGHPTAVAVTEEGEEPKLPLSSTLAGTAEAGTELPPNSRPSHDAGMKPLTPADRLEAGRKAGEAAGAPSKRGKA